MDHLRFPIGRYQPPAAVTEDLVRGWLDDMARLPADLREVTAPLEEEVLDEPYRPGGWTLRQVVHHVVDSHMNSYVRFKWALTENRPEIKVYDEKSWAELPDSCLPVDVSLDLLEHLHRRWINLLGSLEPWQLRLEFMHPETGVNTLGPCIGLYAWHGRHHLAHVEQGLARGKLRRRFNAGGK